MNYLNFMCVLITSRENRRLFISLVNYEIVSSIEFQKLTVAWLMVRNRMRSEFVDIPVFKSNKSPIKEWENMQQSWNLNSARFDHRMFTINVQWITETLCTLANGQTKKSFVCGQALWCAVYLYAREKWISAGVLAFLFYPRWYEDEWEKARKLLLYIEWSKHPECFVVEGEWNVVCVVDGWMQAAKGKWNEMAPKTDMDGMWVRTGSDFRFCTTKSICTRFLPVTDRHWFGRWNAIINRMFHVRFFVSH